MKGRGAFIVFEGVDRCGKTTQTKKLVEALAAGKHKVELARFPDRTTQTGHIIDSYLKNGVELDDHAVHLLFAANRWEAASEIRRKLEAGVSLVCDRYSHSGVCFSAAKETMELEWCKAPEVGLPAPDAVFFLKLEIDVAKQRGEFGAERYEKEDMQRKVLGNFLAMATDKWRVLDASLSVEDLAKQVHAAALDVIKQAADRPIGQLWQDA